MWSVHVMTSACSSESDHQRLISIYGFCVKLQNVWDCDLDHKGFGNSISERFDLKQGIIKAKFDTINFGPLSLGYK